jgi:hypothetical protein
LLCPKKRYEKSGTKGARYERSGTKRAVRKERDERSGTKRHQIFKAYSERGKCHVAVLYKLKGKSQAEDDLRMIRDQSNQRLAKISNNHPIISTDNGFRTAKPFLLSVSLICLQQLSGESCHLKTNLIFRTIDNHYFISVQSYILINEYKWVF